MFYSNGKHLIKIAHSLPTTLNNSVKFPISDLRQKKQIVQTNLARKRFLAATSSFCTPQVRPGNGLGTHMPLDYNVTQSAGLANATATEFNM